MQPVAGARYAPRLGNRLHQLQMPDLQVHRALHLRGSLFRAKSLLSRNAHSREMPIHAKCPFTRNAHSREMNVAHIDDEIIPFVSLFFCPYSRSVLANAQPLWPAASRRVKTNCPFGIESNCRRTNHVCGSRSSFLWACRKNSLLVCKIGRASCRVSVWFMRNDVE